MPESVTEIFKQTDIWKHFESIAERDKVALVNELVGYCAPLLNKITETFPTYTLHDGQHQLNILNLYSRLLGERLKELSDLEAAILILSAFFHDIGMVFKKEERENLRNEELFENFINENPSARLKLEEGLNDELAEWYCRWAHAKRVWVYLDQLNDQLIWEGNNFRKELAHVCLSHNEDTKFIESDEIPENYWNNADLKFCSILLRLADILDFDRTRSPKSVFEFLGIKRNLSESSKVSLKEWEKHLASRGFNFNEWNGESFYPIYFMASPNHPAVENDIRNFLDVIEEELQQCRKTLRRCSKKWSDFTLPEKIDRTQIHSQGYTSGEFRFSLDQKQVLQLLMGENLYENAYVFVRELLQNAIDTTRHRERHEKHIKKSDYSIRPIKISSWYDNEGFKWIRFDDHGMGMTLDQIQNYFLRIGNSFYNSDEFKVSKLKYPVSDKSFTAVSKFGIGILSCFMVADSVEISTKSLFIDNKTIFPIRLSLKGIDNYYFVYSDKDLPKKMPHPTKLEKGYRDETGTSIALKINPNFDRPDFDVSKILRRMVYSSPVQIEYNSVKYGTETIEKLPNQIKIHKLSKKQTLSILDFINDPAIKTMKPEIHMIPITLQDPKIPNVTGKLYIFLLRTNVVFHPKISQKSNNIDWKISYYDSKYNSNTRLQLKVGTHDNYGGYELEFNLSNLIEDLEEFNGQRDFERLRDSIVLSHNGILIRNNPDYDEKGARLDLDFSEKNSEKTLCLGIINFRDNLRPNLNVSRDQIISFPWACFSQLNFLINTCLERSNNSYDFESESNYFSYGTDVDLNWNDIRNDPLLTEEHGWMDVISIDKNGNTIATLKSTEETEALVFDRFDLSPKSALLKELIFRNCIYKVRIFKVKNLNTKKDDNPYAITRKAFIVKRKNVDSSNFPIHYFCEYKNYEGLIPLELNHGLFNVNHRFSKWLMTSYLELEKKYPYYLQSLLKSSSIDNLNLIIDKLKSMLTHEFKPDFTLTQEDFAVNFEELEELDKAEESDAPWYMYELQKLSLR